MSKSRVDMIIETLRDNPNKKFTAKELALEFIKRYPNEMAVKQANARYKTQEQLIAQVTAEIGGSRIARAKKLCPNITTQDKPRPRLHFWTNDPAITDSSADILDNGFTEPEIDIVVSNEYSEHDLYPLLIEFLKEEHKLHCQRIDEKTSKNSHGSKGNHWLHPDIVALETLDQRWDIAVKECVRHGNDNRIRLWSFEVKKQLTKSNVRESFFQAVSNSTWANFGYLVTTALNNDVEQELQMLASLHGIGVLLLNTESLFDSQILIPARERQNIDWQSVNRIVTENSDFHRFIEQVGIYIQTGRIVKSVWNK